MGRDVIDPRMAIHTFPEKFNGTITALVLDKLMPPGSTPSVGEMIPKVDKEIVFKST